MDSDKDRDTASPSHQRPPYADPLAEGVDPTAPRAPHEPGGTDYHQSSDDQAAQRRDVDASDSGDDAHLNTPE